jgi:hypothetical protein
VPGRPIPVAAQTKGWVCNGWLAQMRVRIPPVVWMPVSCKCCMLFGRGLCDGPITSSDGSYRVWYVYGEDYTRLLYLLLANEFSRQLLSEQGVNSSCLVHIGMKRLSSQQVALEFIIRHLRDELKNFSVLSHATFWPYQLQ